MQKNNGIVHHNCEIHSELQSMYIYDSHVITSKVLHRMQTSNVNAERNFGCSRRLTLSSTHRFGCFFTLHLDFVSKSVPDFNANAHMIIRSEKKLRTMY